MKLSFELFAATVLATVELSTALDPTDYAECSAYPDPHFKTWHNDYYSYHGGCDLVLIKNKEFASSVGLYLHIRTRDQDSDGNSLGWSRITNAALRINNDILEVKDNNDYFVDGILNPPLPIDIGFYPLSITPSGTSTIYEVDLGMTQYVRVKHSPPDSLRVDVRGHGEEFLESVGLCGTWTTPGMIARDGGTDFLPDADEFGEDWQVRNTEPLLFQPVAGVHPSPQYPEACVPAPDVSDRFDDQDKVEEAEKDCENVEGPDFKNCVFDVVVTGDNSWVDEYEDHVYEDPSCPWTQSCEARGGECVKECHISKICDDEICCPSVMPPPCDCKCEIPRDVAIPPVLCKQTTSRCKKEGGKCVKKCKKSKKCNKNLCCPSSVPCDCECEISRPIRRKRGEGKGRL